MPTTSTVLQRETWATYFSLLPLSFFSLLTVLISFLHKAKHKKQKNHLSHLFLGVPPSSQSFIFFHFKDKLFNPCYTYLLAHLLCIPHWLQPAFFLHTQRRLISQKSQMTLLALNPADTTLVLLLCLNSEQAWKGACAHLLKVLFFPSVLQKVLSLWIFFSLLTSILYFSNYSLNGPYGQSTLNFPGATPPTSILS